MKLQTCQAHETKAYEYNSMLLARGHICTDTAREIRDQRSAHQCIIGMGQQITTAPVFGASGKPSTWQPLVELAEFSPSPIDVKNLATSAHSIGSLTHLGYTVLVLDCLSSP